MSDGRTRIALINLLANGLAVVAIAASTSTALRVPAATIVIFGTGVAFVPLLRVSDLALNLTLILLTSIAVLICVAQAVTYIAAFSWRPCQYCLLAITVAGCASQLLSRWRRRQTE